MRPGNFHTLHGKIAGSDDARRSLRQTFFYKIWKNSSEIPVTIIAKTFIFLKLGKSQEKSGHFIDSNYCIIKYNFLITPLMMMRPININYIDYQITVSYTPDMPFLAVNFCDFFVKDYPKKLFYKPCL